MSEKNPNEEKILEAASWHWRKNLICVGWLLSVWFLVSYGCGILWVDALDKIQFGGFKLGFWFAQQGSMVIFVLLIAVYVWYMNRLDRALARRLRDLKQD